VSIVDCFQKEDEEFRRITYRLTFQSTERTLLKEEVDAAMDTLLAEMKARYQLELVY
jgi:phenylalanyl-tRNA synthetase beta subunit